MSFTGNEGEFISLSDAATLTAAHRSSNPNALQGHFLGKAKILDLLNQSGCKGLRIYHGESSTGVREIVMVGVDSNEDDILDSTNPLVLDTSTPCPPTCGSSNALNS